MRVSFKVAWRIAVLLMGTFLQHHFERFFSWNPILFANCTGTFSKLRNVTEACSRHYQKKKKVMGLERGPLSLVSTNEELLDRKVAAPV
jgi:hypothetical protein